MYPDREPTFSERLFFLNNPNVGGYASFDTNSVVHNPYNNFTSQQRQGIRINENTRLFLNNHPSLQPTYNLTPYQQRALGNYSNNIQDIKNTLAGRYFSNDKSFGIPSSEQQQQLEKILRYMKVLGY